MVALPALLVWLVFAAASIFAGQVASRSFSQIHVLLEENDCGSWSISIESAGSISAAYAGFISKITKDVKDAQSYARDWYNGSSTSLTAQSLFPVTRLPFENATVPCPFPNAQRCALGPSSAISMETHMLDSHVHFGINAPKSDRVLFQKNLVCSVLAVDDLTYENETLISFFLGPTNIDDGSTFEIWQIDAFELANYGLR
jgi:hypothetical protein